MSDEYLDAISFAAADQATQQGPSPDEIDAMVDAYAAGIADPEGEDL